MMGGPTPSSLVVTARLDRDGDAATKGPDDLVATSAALAPGAQNVTLALAASAPVAATPAVTIDAPGVVTGVDAASVIGPPAGPPLEGEALREATMEAGRLLRCVVCQGLSVADSPSETAKAMRGQVEALVAQGYDTEQVLAWFEASYGAFVRLEPKSEGLNWLVWLAPAAVVLVGGLAILLGTRRGKGQEAPVDADDPLAPWLARVRAETRPDAGEETR
jgi:cytochrome c-type biogenesis protein CcmH